MAFIVWLLDKFIFFMLKTHYLLWKQYSLLLLRLTIRKLCSLLILWNWVWIWLFAVRKVLNHGIRLNMLMVLIGLWRWMMLGVYAMGACTIWLCGKEMELARHNSLSIDELSNRHLTINPTQTCHFGSILMVMFKIGWWNMHIVVGVIYYWILNSML